MINIIEIDIHDIFDINHDSVEWKIIAKSSIINQAWEQRPFILV